MDLGRWKDLANEVRGQCTSRDSGHDFEHVLRVTRNAIRIAKELNLDLDIVVPAALLHDLIHIPKNHPDRARASALAAEEARKYLTPRGVSAEHVARICQAIEEHSFSAKKQPSSIESAVLQDADRLDAIGAIGIARVFACGESMGSSFYDPSDAWAGARALDDKKFALDHFYVKLLKLPELMNTDPGKREAQRREDFMKAYLLQLRDEIG